MNEKEVLYKIGLSENEAEVYLTLLRLGPASAYQIAQKSGIYRPHVYDKLETLADKGLVSHVQRGKKKIFTAAPPSKIMNYLKEQEDSILQDIALLRQNMKRLEAMHNLPKEDISVQVFSGVEGLKLLMEDICKTVQPKSKILLFGLDETKYNETLPIYMPQYFKRIKEKGVKEWVITQKKKEVFVFDNKVSEYRFLDSDQINPTNTIIYGNNVAFVIWGTPITSILIENKQLALTYREHFEYLWGIAKKMSKKGK